MSDTAVVVVDMMNTYQHPDAEDLIPNVEKIMDPLAGLVRRIAKEIEVLPVGTPEGIEAAAKLVG